MDVCWRTSVAFVWAPTKTSWPRGNWPKNASVLAGPSQRHSTSYPIVWRVHWTKRRTTWREGGASKHLSAPSNRRIFVANSTVSSSTERDDDASSGSPVENRWGNTVKPSFDNTILRLVQCTCPNYIPSSSSSSSSSSSYITFYINIHNILWKKS